MRTVVPAVASDPYRELTGAAFMSCCAGLYFLSDVYKHITVKKKNRCVHHCHQITADRGTTIEHRLTHSGRCRHRYTAHSQTDGQPASQPAKQPNQVWTKFVLDLLRGAGTLTIFMEAVPFSAITLRVGEGARRLSSVGKCRRFKGIMKNGGL